MDEHIYSVTELTREIKQILETSFPRLWAEGEISNFKRHSSGHLYLTLKDENSQIRCAMWNFRAKELLFKPEDGMKVVVEGDVQVYERGGNYQLIIQQLHPSGIGELQLAFEQLKKRLQEEGLFESEHKVSIPQFPERVGVITSPTGAAIRDVLSVISRRAPWLKVILYPVRVQGKGAAKEISDAIRDFNDFADIDLLIVCRGGGSLEDLWAFNEEAVAREIYHSKIPVISAVGHEIDFSIADFVADLRAPTPSAAAEIVARDRSELQGSLNYYGEKFSTTISQNLLNYRERIDNLKRSYGFRRPEDVVFQKMQQLDDLSKSIQIAIRHQLSLKQQQHTNFLSQINVLNPLSILNRGYSICYKDGTVVKDVKQVKALDMVQVRLAKGQFISQVQILGDSK